jgi:hypothetical protein
MDVRDFDQGLEQACQALSATLCLCQQPGTDTVKDPRFPHFARGPTLATQLPMTQKHIGLGLLTIIACAGFACSSGSGGGGGGGGDAGGGATCAWGSVYPALFDEADANAGTGGAATVTGSIVAMGTGGLSGDCGTVGSLETAWWIRIQDAAKAATWIACVDATGFTAPLSVGDTVTATQRYEGVEFTSGLRDLTIRRDDALVVYAVYGGEKWFNPPPEITYHLGAKICGGDDGGEGCSATGFVLDLTAGTATAAVTPEAEADLGPYRVHVARNLTDSGSGCDSAGRDLQMWISLR